MENLEEDELVEVLEEEVLVPLDKDYNRIFQVRTIIVLVSIGVMIVTSMFSNYHDFNIVLRSNILIFVLTFSMFATVGCYLYVRSLNEEKKVQSSVLLKRMLEVLDVLVIVPVFMLVVTIVNASSFSLSNVVGRSMEPNFFDHEDVVIMHLPLMKYERLDAVVVKIDEDIFYIKRIIGLPGEFIVIDDGVIYRGVDKDSELVVINETSLGTLNETYCTVNTGDYCEFIVPSNSYFVLGDNRTNSSDSRNPNIGFIESENLFGKVIFKYKNILRNRP